LALLSTALTDQTYYWSESMCALIEAASSELPDVPLQSEHFPQGIAPDNRGLFPYGCFFWFSRPLPIFPGDPPMVAIALTCVHATIEPDTTSKPTMFCYLLGLAGERTASDDPAQDIPVIRSSFHWRLGETLYGLLEESERYCQEQCREAGIIEAAKIRRSVQRAEILTRYLVASLVLLGQKVVKTDELPADRSLQRRAKRGGRHSIPPIHVVHLREFERANEKPIGTGESTSSKREYAVQWIVSGHWRQQYYPSLKRHQLRWIAPYRKGPADKPLKVGRPTVYAVTR
jgi:hypothetical protein